ncbi:MAG: NIPSNAP family protein [Candidatus Helarchaeota archaeon]|nr:NIPSNAP family protein [Candidatus Helarchaeota archaeon]
MIYLEETFNLVPASPEGLDVFVEFAQERLMPVCQRLELRLVAAWYSNVELFSKVTHVLEFDDIEALKAFRIKASQDLAWGEYAARLEELAPERHSRLLEPLETVPPKILHKAIARSQRKPLGVYSLAVLEVAPGKMAGFIAGLKDWVKTLPIIASWRPIAGKPNEVIDVWKGALLQSGYKPADDFSKQFFRQVREIAPREYLRTVYTLPYSQLR